jgi:uncharacterized protein
MEQRISVVTLGVKDLGVSKRFYIDGLGWQPVFSDEEIAFFQAGGLIFALFLRHKLVADFHGDQGAFGLGSRLKPRLDNRHGLYREI